jgi:hypothetical protein
VIPGLVLAALVVVAGLGPDGRLGGLLLAATAVLWILVNKPMEGATLVAVAEDHGLTAGDLAGLVGVLLGGWRAFRPRARARHRVE